MSTFVKIFDVMKRVFVLIAALSIITLDSCQREVLAGGGDEGGKKFVHIVLNATSGSGETKTTIGGLFVKWEANDSVSIYDGTANRGFVLTAGAGSNSGTFEGDVQLGADTYPALYPFTNGATFDASGVSNVILPALQTISAGKCVDSSATLMISEAKHKDSIFFQNAVAYVKVNPAVGCKKIILRSNNSSDKIAGTGAVTYSDTTFTASTGVDSIALEGDFTKGGTYYFAVAPGTLSGGLRIDFLNAKGDTVSKSSTTGSTLLKRGVVYNGGGGTLVIPQYPGVSSSAFTFLIGGVWWAPVNCGYDASHTYGLVYQWGRKKGVDYGESPSVTITTQFGGDNGDDKENYFYKSRYAGSGTYAYDWITNGNNNYWTSGKGTFDPCPDGWRVPTREELNALLGGATGFTGFKTDNRTDSPMYGISGQFFNGTTAPGSDSSVFLPASGARGGTDGIAHSRGSWGLYWSSTVTGAKCFDLFVQSNAGSIASHNRSDGISLRCVHD